MKGAAIKIYGGKYKGREAWLDVSMGDPPKQAHIYVKMGDNERDLKRTKINRLNFRLKDGKRPKTYAQAVLMQHPEVESQFNKVCTLLAKLGIKDSNSMGEIQEFFKVKLGQAVKCHQEKFGVTFEEEDNDYLKHINKRPIVGK